jgi:hypothetical protein
MFESCYKKLFRGTTNKEREKNGVRQRKNVERVERISKGRKNEGEIEFTKSGIPTYGYQNIRVTYTAGYESVPYFIQRLSTAIVAKRVIMTVINGSASEIGGSVSVGTISVTDPSSFGHNHLKSLTQEINELFKSAKFKNYNITRNY